MLNPGTLVFYVENDYTLVLSKSSDSEFIILHINSDKQPYFVHITKDNCYSYLLVDSSKYLHT